MSRSRGASAQPESVTRFFCVERRAAGGAARAAPARSGPCTTGTRSGPSGQAFLVGSRLPPTAMAVRCLARGRQPAPAAPLRTARSCAPLCRRRAGRRAALRAELRGRRSGRRCSWCSASASACRTRRRTSRPPRTWLWQLEHSTVPAGAAGAADSGAGRPAAAAAARACWRRGLLRRGLLRRRLLLGRLREAGAAAGEAGAGRRRVRRPAASAPASSGRPCPCRRRGTSGSPRAPPWAMPSPAPCSASAWAACRKPPASRL